MSVSLPASTVRSGVRHHRAAPEKGHGRVDRRQLDALPLPGRMVRFDKARQAMRIIRERTELRTGETTTETVYALTSVSAERADPEQLLAWNRGHWMVENANHYRRDATFGEDASRIRAREQRHPEQHRARPSNRAETSSPVGPLTPRSRNG